MRRFAIVMILMSMVIVSQALPYEKARNRALFLSDKMAYELRLSDAQYDAVYQVNLDYLLTIGSRSEVYGRWWQQRNIELENILYPDQYQRYISIPYFYRPIAWENGRISYGVYNRYRDGRRFRARPRTFADYRGGRYFRRDFRRGPAPRQDFRRGPAPRQNFRGGPGPRNDVRRGPAPAPRQNFRGGPAPRNDVRRGPAPRNDVRRGPAPRNDVRRGPDRRDGRVTPNGMVQREDRTTRTTVRVRRDPNQRP